MKTPDIGAALIAALYALGGIFILLCAIIPNILHFSFGTSAMMVIYALIVFAVAYGIWNMQTWAWYVAMIVSSLGVISSVVSLNIVGIVIPGLIVWYLWNNKKEFGA